MKTITKYLVVLLVVYACQEESYIAPTEAIETELNDDVNSKDREEYPFAPLITGYIEYGEKICPTPNSCYCDFDSLYRICEISLDYYQFPPLEFEEPPILWDPCENFPCGWDYNDPWEIFEAFEAGVFGSIKDYFEIEIEQPTAQAFLFPINEEILGMQFYEINQLMGDPNPQPNIYYVNDEIIIDAVIAEELGLHGQVIEPNEYPIIYNEENHTYNVIFKIQ